MAGPAFRLEGAGGRRVVVVVVVLGGFEGGGKTEKGEEEEIHALQYCCVVCGTLPFVCLAITYSAQGHSSRG